MTLSFKTNNDNKTVMFFFIILVLGLVEVIDLPGVVITEYECVVLAGECAWLLPYEDHFPTLAHVQHMTSFNHVVRYILLKL